MGSTTPALGGRWTKPCCGGLLRRNILAVLGLGDGEIVQQVEVGQCGTDGFHVAGTSKQPETMHKCAHTVSIDTQPQSHSHTATATQPQPHSHSHSHSHGRHTHNTHALENTRVHGCSAGQQLKRTTRTSPATSKSIQTTQDQAAGGAESQSTPPQATQHQQSKSCTRASVVGMQTSALAMPGRARAPQFEQKLRDFDRMIT